MFFNIRGKVIFVKIVVGCIELIFLCSCYIFGEVGILCEWWFFLCVRGLKDGSLFFYWCGFVIVFRGKEVRFVEEFSWEFFLYFCLRCLVVFFIYFFVF